MTDYNDGKWHGWNGGECPVHPKSVVQIVLDEGRQPTNRTLAGEFGWDHSLFREGKIVAFRVTKPYREPRDFWVNEYDRGIMGDIHSSKKEADEYAKRTEKRFIRTIHLREVIEE